MFYKEIQLTVYFAFNIWNSDKFILVALGTTRVAELLPKPYGILPTCLLVNNNLCGELVSWVELLLVSDDSLRVESVRFFAEDFDSLSCDSLSCHFILVLY